jgi:hypothetical protein
MGGSRRGVSASPGSEAIALDALSKWCQVHLDSGVDTLLFEEGFATRVIALRLRDGRDVVVKVRPYTHRDCAEPLPFTPVCGKSAFRAHGRW